MPTATLTSKGQLTLPKVVRDRLNLRTGDTVDFVIEADGTVQMRAGAYEARELRGLLKKPGQKLVSLESMDRAIRAGRSRTP